MKISFKIQGIIAAIIVVASFILSFCLEKDIFYNLGWVLVGAFFAVNPVYPSKLFNANSENIQKGVRIAGLILIFIGLTNGFGV